MRCSPNACCKGVYQQDSARSWIILLTATLHETMSYTMTYCYSIILPVLVKEFNQTREKAAWIASVAFSLLYLATPVSALVAARIGNRWTAVLGSIMCTLSLVGSSFAPSLEFMYITHGLLFGFGTNLIHLPGILTIQRCFNKRRALATGIFATGSSFAALIGPLFTFFVNHLGWRTTFWVIGLWFLAPLVMVLPLYDANFDDKAERTDTRTEDNKWRCRMSCSYWNSWFAIGVISIGVQSFGMYVPLSHMIKHANEVGYPHSKSSVLLVYFGVASLLGKIVAGRILDSPRVCVYWVNQFSGLISTISMILLAFSKSDKGFIPFAILYGIGNGSFLTSQYQLWMTSVSPDQRPMGLATGEVVAAIGVLTGSPFIGFLADQSGSYRISFLVAAGLIFAASLVLFLRFCFKKNSFEPKNTEFIILDSDIYEVLEKETVL